MGIPPGLVGKVVWDEGGEEVIVEFAEDVPNFGYALPARQAWIHRSCLAIER